MSTDIPVYETDIFTDENILDPYPRYQEIRDLGPVVRLASTGKLAVGRFDDVREVLGDWERFSSADGVAIVPFINDMIKGNSLSSDPPLHTELRKTVAPMLTPRAMEDLKDTIKAEADALVDRLVGGDSFDGITEFAHHLPLTVVSNLVGLPEDGRENMLAWAAAAFDSLGAENARFGAAAGMAGGVMKYIGTLDTPDKVKEGSWTHQLFEAEARGEIPKGKAQASIADFTVPSLDTTIGATGHLIHHLGKNPDQWDMLRADPSLIRSAIEETLRIDSPIRGFSRRVTQDTEISGAPIKADEWIFVMYASGNRDERRWTDPDRFDITREGVRQHVGFGYGIHQCVGQHLARLEIQSLLEAMVERVERIEVAEPEFGLNNILRLIKRMDVRFH